MIMYDYIIKNNDNNNKLKRCENWQLLGSTGDISFTIRKKDRSQHCTLWNLAIDVYEFSYITIYCNPLFSISLEIY